MLLHCSQQHSPIGWSGRKDQVEKALAKLVRTHLPEILSRVVAAPG